MPAPNNNHRNPAKKKKETLSSKLFLHINLKTEVLRFSNSAEKNDEEISFASHAVKYTESDISNIIEAFCIKKVKYADGEVVDSKTFFMPKKTSFGTTLQEYKNQELKKNIFYLKKTQVQKYFNQIKEQQMLVLAKVKNTRVEVLKKEYVFNGNAITFVVAFSDNAEIENFKKAENKKNEIDEYVPFEISFKDIKKCLQNKEGIYINPNSANVLGKNFSFAISSDFLKNH